MLGPGILEHITHQFCYFEVMITHLFFMLLITYQPLNQLTTRIAKKIQIHIDFENIRGNLE